MFFSKAPQKADKENRNNTGHAIFRPENQVVPDNEPTGTTKTMERGAEGRVWPVVKIWSKKGIQAAGKKPVNWNKIKEINQEPTEKPLAFQ